MTGRLLEVGDEADAAASCRIRDRRGPASGESYRIMCGSSLPGSGFRSASREERGESVPRGRSPYVGSWSPSIRRRVVHRPPTERNPSPLPLVIRNQERGQASRGAAPSLLARVAPGGARPEPDLKEADYTDPSPPRSELSRCRALASCVPDPSICRAVHTSCTMDGFDGPEDGGVLGVRPTPSGSPVALPRG